MQNITTLLATVFGIGLLTITPSGAAPKQPADPTAVQKAFDDAMQQMRVQLQHQADQGDPEAQLKLGMVYERGMGVEADQNKAQDLFKLSFKPLEERANEGDPVDQLLVGMMYENGMGTAKDEAKARALYDQSSASLQKIADQGDSRALRALGWKHEEGLGGPRNIQKAHEYYKRASEHDRASASHDAG